MPAAAQVYRWVDEKGTVHYSNSTPPAGAKFTIIDRDAKAGPPSPDSAECYTVRCQGERLEQRLARREASDARYAAERAAATPPRPKGLDFRQYLSPTTSDPFTTTVTVIGGRVNHIERVRKF